MITKVEYLHFKSWTQSGKLSYPKEERSDVEIISEDSSDGEIIVEGRGSCLIFLKITSTYLE